MLRRTVCAWEKLVIVESPNKVIKVEGLLSSPRVIPDWSFGKTDLKAISAGAERAIAMATTGHFMSLRELSWAPQSLAVTPGSSEDFPANGVLSSFSLEWELIPGRHIRDTVSHYIEEKADNLTEIIVATDPDREGELIAVHAQNLIKRMFPDLKVPFTRAYMHSITEDGIRRAMQERHEAFDYNLANAAEARHAMDRIFGFLGSSVVRYANPQMRSIGRVQTPALILINDRETRIKAFLETHGSTFDVQAICHFTSKQNQRFSQVVKVLPPPKNAAALASDSAVPSSSSVDWKDRTAVTRQCERWRLSSSSQFRVSPDCAPQETSSAAPKPFTMATLISKANRQLHFTSDMVSSCLQDLFQMGFITYPRTDSTRIDESALPAIYAAIRMEYGKRLLQEDDSKTAHPPTRKSQKNKEAAEGNVEDAHEAIRPTDIGTTADDLGNVSASTKQLYDLVRRQTLAAFMIPMRTERVVVPVQCKAGNGDLVEFQLQGKHVVEPGWSLAFRPSKASTAAATAAVAAQEAETEQDVRAAEDGGAVVPSISDDEFAAIMDVAARRSSSNALRLEASQVVESRPSPPLPFSEGSLIEQLKNNGVGRPSTYPTIVKTLLARNYVMVNKGRCETTAVGRMLVDTSKATFPSIVDIGFTSSFEKKLDRIAKPQDEAEARPWKLPPSVSEADFVLSSFISNFLNYVTDATKAKRAEISVRSLTLQHQKSSGGSTSSREPSATAGATPGPGSDDAFQSTVERESKRVAAQVPDLVENVKSYRTFTALQNSLNDYLRRHFPASATASSGSARGSYYGAGRSSSYGGSKKSHAGGSSSSAAEQTGKRKKKTSTKTADTKVPRRFQEKKKTK